MKTILVVGREWKFRALLRAQLREEGYPALGFATLEEAVVHLASGTPPPAALVFDTTEAPAVEMRAELAALAESRRAGPVMVVAAAHEQFDWPSLHVLRRPLRLGEVVAAVRELAGDA
ncbi:MAG: hypothetical protein ACE5HL_05560 [Terriglobia bacterium]